MATRQKDLPNSRRAASRRRKFARSCVKITTERIYLLSSAAFHMAFGTTPRPVSVWRFLSLAGARRGGHWARNAFEGGRAARG